MNVIQERVLHPDQCYRWLHLVLGAFRAPLHRHRHIELTWIERSAGMRMVGDSVEAFSGQDMVLLGPDLAHTWLSNRQGAGKEHVATVLQFSADLLFANGVPELKAMHSLAERARRGLHIDGDAREAIAMHLRRLGQCEGLGALSALFALFDALVAHQDAMRPLASKASGLLHPQQADHDRRISRVLAWVHRHLGSDLRVEEAARLVHVSPAAFSRYFHREVGKTFTAYVNDVRCAQACTLLRDSDKPVLLVAQRCGYATLSHFNRQFRARVGMTPGEYRRSG